MTESKSEERPPPGAQDAPRDDAALDPRRNAYRADLAAVSLRGACRRSALFPG